MTVIVNGRTAVHQKSNGKLHTTDVCLTPPYAIPIPFSNVAQSQHVQKAARNVFINGNPMAHKKSIFYKSSGDEGGLMMGISSASIGGKAEFLQGSPNVFCEGFAAVRQLDKMVSNNRNTAPEPLMQPGAGVPASVQAKLDKLNQQQQTNYVLDTESLGDAHLGRTNNEIILHNNQIIESTVVNRQGDLLT